MFPIFFICNSCSSTERRDIQMVNEIVDKYSLELKRERGLYLIGRGGRMMDDIQQVYVEYTSVDAPSVDEVRKLYVEIAEEYLQRINSNEELRPYLHVYPFTIENLALTLSFEDVAYRIRKDGYVAYAYIPKDNLIYYKEYKSDEQYHLLLSEPYAEAVKIVECEKRSQE